MHAPQRLISAEMPAFNVSAQVAQRRTGWAKRVIQGSHTMPLLGQALQTAHWLGMWFKKRLRERLTKRLNIDCQYTLSMPTQRPPTISPSAATHWQRIAPAATPWLHEEVARRMVERLQWINIQPKAWAHWGAVRGGQQAHAALLEKYPNSACFLPLDFEFIADAAIKNIVNKKTEGSKWTLSKLFKSAPKVIYATPTDGAVDMLWANMQLHNALDPQVLISQWHKAIATDGFLMFSCLGPDTLRELRGMYEKLGWPVPTHQFTDMHDWGDMLIQAGFAEPVMDMERIVLTYETPQKLLEDLRELGRNLHPERFPALRGKAWKAKLEAALVEHLADPAEGGRLKLTFEVIYGHAMKPKPRVKLSEHSAVSLRDMKEMLQGGRR